MKEPAVLKKTYRPSWLIFLFEIYSTIPDLNSAEEDQNLSLNFLP